MKKRLIRGLVAVSILTGIMLFGLSFYDGFSDVPIPSLCEGIEYGDSIYDLKKKLGPPLDTDGEGYTFRGAAHSAGPIRVKVDLTENRVHERWCDDGLASWIIDSTDEFIFARSRLFPPI